MCRPSDLSYGLEPHDHIYSADCTRTAVREYTAGGAGRGGVPGVVQWGGTGGVLYRVLTHASAYGQFEAYLWNIID